MSKQKGMPEYTPTPAERERVMLMTGYGMTYLEICSVMKNPRTGNPISVNTLQKHFRSELKEGAAYVKACVIGNLVKRATKDHPSAVAAAIWITKARYGWKSTERFEHTHEGNTTGVLVVPPTKSPTDWVNEQRGKNGKRKAPVAEAS